MDYGPSFEPYHRNSEKYRDGGIAWEAKTWEHGQLIAYLPIDQKCAKMMPGLN